MKASNVIDVGVTIATRVSFDVHVTVMRSAGAGRCGNTNSNAADVGAVLTFASTNEPNALVLSAPIASMSIKFRATRHTCDNITVTPAPSTAVRFSVCTPALKALMLTLATDETILQSTSQGTLSSTQVMFCTIPALSTSATAVVLMCDVGLRGADDQRRPTVADGDGVRDRVVRPSAEEIDERGELVVVTVGVIVSVPVLVVVDVAVSVID